MKIVKGEPTWTPAELRHFLFVWITALGRYDPHSAQADPLPETELPGETENGKARLSEAPSLPVDPHETLPGAPIAT
jgi:hypothetical protein